MRTIILSLFLLQTILCNAQTINTLKLKTDNDSVKIHIIKTGETSVKKYFYEAGKVRLISIVKMFFRTNILNICLSMYM